MLEEQVIVVDVNQDGVWVESEKVSACASCQSKSNCSQGLLSDIGLAKKVVIHVANPTGINVKKHDQAVIGIEEQAFMHMSVLQYMLPLITMFLSGAAAASFNLSEPLTIVSAVSGLILGLGVVRTVSRGLSKRSNYHPTLLRIV